MNVSQLYLIPHPRFLVNEGDFNSSQQRVVDGYQTVLQELSKEQPSTIVVIQSHGGIHPDGVTFTVPDESLFQMMKGLQPVSLSFDSALAAQMQKSLHDYARKTNVLEETSLPYPAELIVQYMLHLELPIPKMVVVGISLEGSLAHYEYGSLMARALAADSEKVAVVVSGQLSHCHNDESEAGVVPFAAEFDDEVLACLEQGSWDQLFHMDPFLIQDVGEDLYRPLATGLGIINALEKPLEWNSKGYHIVQGIGCLAGVLSVKT